MHFIGLSTAEENLEHTITLLESSQLIVPERASLEDGPRRPTYNPNELRRSLGSHHVNLQIWRTKPPKYEGLVDICPELDRAMGILFWSAPKDGWQALFEAVSAIAGGHKVLFGFVFPFWLGSPDSYSTMSGFRLYSLQTKGWWTVYPRMWFGKQTWPLIERVVVPYEGGIIRELANGVVEFDVRPDPWTLSFEEYAEHRARFEAALRAEGIAADFSESRRPKPAPNWTPVEWKDEP